MVSQICINFGWGTGLLPDGTKPLPQPMLTYHQLGSVALNLRPISQEVLMISIHKMSIKKYICKITVKSLI